MSEEEQKYEAVKKALDGLDVQYINHDGFHDEVPNMARVNGYSIIWHEWAYCYGEPDTVEVMIPDGDVYGHYKIANLRKLVEVSDE